MGQAFVDKKRVPVSVVKAGPCVVTYIKNEDKDGYWALQLGFGKKKIKNVTKPLQGHLKGAINEKEKTAPRFLREVRLDKEPELKVGDVVKVSDIFKVGDTVQVTGMSKGKGFAGAVKRWKFAGGPKTHGQSDRHRAPGAIGQGTTPGRVFKGKRMAGRMGSSQVTVKNLHVISIDSDENTMLISGALPGRIGGLLTINRIKAGSLKDLEHEVVATVVEGEPEAKTEGESQENES